jgi:putative GTP pyrophosphokinase
VADALSKTAVDNLGDRLRKGTATESDIILLDQYRLTSGDAYECVNKTIKEKLLLSPTGRPAKSTTSIIEKLHRETIRLSQIQDIAGCRILVDDCAEQTQTTQKLMAVFPGSLIIDRIRDPRYGYRAIHIVVMKNGKYVEIQVRTKLQHLWAELSEKLSDIYDPSIKYGGGEEPERKFLKRLQKLIEKFEKAESCAAQRSCHEADNGHLDEKGLELLTILPGLKEEISSVIRESISSLETKKVLTL